MIEILEEVDKTLNARDGNVADPTPLFEDVYEGWSAIMASSMAGPEKVAYMLIWLKMVRMMYRSKTGTPETLHDNNVDGIGYFALADVMMKVRLGKK